MKLKSLNKKIRRLEARLTKVAKKLARLKRKREAVGAAALAKTKSKSTAFPAKRTGKTVPISAPTRKKTGGPMPKRLAKSADVSGRSSVKKMKRKLNLTPERRAQLAAAMKVRWAAKRATAAATPQNTPAEQEFTIGDTSQQ